MSSFDDRPVAHVRYESHPVPPAPADERPHLHDVTDEIVGRVSIFNPERCSGEDAHWIQVDRAYAVSAQEVR